jgi:phospholipase/carboxylesterase
MPSHASYTLRADTQDVKALDIRQRRAGTHASKMCDADETRVAIDGFSDGASHALTLGVANGDLLTHILAFSWAQGTPFTTGKPSILVSRFIGFGIANHLRA